MGTCRILFPASMPAIPKTDTNRTQKWLMVSRVEDDAVY